MKPQIKKNRKMLKDKKMQVRMRRKIRRKKKQKPPHLNLQVMITTLTWQKKISIRSKSWSLSRMKQLRNISSRLKSWKKNWKNINKNWFIRGPRMITQSRDIGNKWRNQNNLRFQNLRKSCLTCVIIYLLPLSMWTWKNLMQLKI